MEYEDELDLLAVVVTDGKDGEGRAQVRLHDNESGKLLRTVELTESWDEVTDLSWLLWHDTSVPPCWAYGFLSHCLFQTYRHELFFDKDTIVHVEQKSTSFCCHVYKLNIARKWEAGSLGGTFSWKTHCSFSRPLFYIKKNTLYVIIILFW